MANDNDNDKAPGETLPERIVMPNGSYLIPIRNREDARALVKRRWEKAGAAARRGMAKAGQQIPEVDKRSSIAVLEHLAEVHTLNAADPSAPNSVQSLKQVLSLAYPKPEKVDEEDAPKDSTNDLRELLALWKKAKAENPELAERAQMLLDRKDDES